MTYQEMVREQMRLISEANANLQFIGYNTKCGHRMYGTLEDVEEEKCLETPVAENLMVGIAAGMALEGFLPVVCFERMDFILPALDAIVNHVDKFREMVVGKKLPVVFRVVVGTDKPLDPGPQHKGDYTEVLQKMLKMPVIPLTSKDVVDYYSSYVTSELDKPMMFIEYKKLYNV